MSSSPPRFPGTTAAEDVLLDRLERRRDESSRRIDPSFDRLVTQLDEAQATLLSVRRHTSETATVDWLDAALCDALSEAEFLRDRARGERYAEDF